MASLALPRIPRPALPRLPSLSPRAIVARPPVRVGVAAVALAAAGAMLFLMLRPAHRDVNAITVPLAPVLAHAPQGWRESQPAARSGPQVTRDVIRLSERPLPPLADSAWNRPAAALPPLRPGDPLPVAPVPGFFTPALGGPLPIIATTGRTPFEVYRRPFLPNGRPRVALVVGGLGLNARETQQAIETLPAEITLAFSPYAEGLQGWVDAARAHGHEVLLEAPMEPVDYPENDPGAYTLVTGPDAPDDARRLELILTRAAGYFGLINRLGDRFLTSNEPFQAFAASLRSRGLAFVDDGGASLRHEGGVARASAERVVDQQLTGPAIQQQLRALEAGALQRGAALGMASAYPVSLERVAEWSRGLEARGFQLAPASAMTHAAL